MTPKKPCRLSESRRPYRTIVFCECGWMRSVFHRNALARASMANAAGKKHLECKETK